MADFTFDDAAVAAWLKLPDRAEDRGQLPVICAAVSSFVNDLPHVDEQAAWPDRVTLAALMLAGRLFRRRNSPAGVEAFGADGAAYVSRADPDVARLLKIDRYAPPQVG